MSLLDKLSGLVGGHDNDVPDEPLAVGYVAVDTPVVTVTEDIEAQPNHADPGMDAVRKLKEECQEKKN